MTTQRKVIVVLLALVLAMGALAAVEFTRVRDIFYTQITESAARGLRDRLLLFLSPPIDNMLVVKSWIATAEAGQGPQKTLITMLHPVLAGQKAVSAVMLSDRQGLVCLLSQNKDGFTGVVRSPEGQTGLQWLRFGPDMAPLDSQTEGATTVSPAEAEARRKQLVSLETALGAGWAFTGLGKPIWSGVHEVPGLTGPCISASILVGDKPSNDLMMTLSFSLSDIKDVCAKDLPTGNEKVLIFSPEGGILDFEAHRNAFGIAGEPLFDNAANAVGQGASKTAGEKLGGVVNAADGIPATARFAWTRDGKPVGQAYRFQAVSAPWWASLEPLVEEGSRVFVGAAIPQDDLWQELLSGASTLLLVVSGLTVVLILLVVLLLYYRRGLGASEASFFPTEAAVAALIAQGEGDRLEFKSTLRQNLNSGKPGKEIELASLKTLAAFLNSQGGILVVGVDDAGRVLGLEADGFENDDHLLRHFGSLVNQHLGIECARYLLFAIRPAPDGKVFIVRCSKSREPVFLDNGKDEEFYVRVGPSSRKLTLRQFYALVTRGKGGR